jgi:hypothetical protein
MTHASVPLSVPWPRGLPRLSAFERAGLSCNTVRLDDGDAVSQVDTGGGLHAEQRTALGRIERCVPRAVIPGHYAPVTDMPAARAPARLDALAATRLRNAHTVIKRLIKFWPWQVRTTTPAARPLSSTLRRRGISP